MFASLWRSAVRLRGRWWWPGRHRAQRPDLSRTPARLHADLATDRSRLWPAAHRGGGW